MLLIAVINILSILMTCCVTVGNALNVQCATAIKEVEEEDRGTVTENLFALYATWLSQGCEMQPGPQYVIRKYTFFRNNTFLLLRFYYADESCSIASHTITIRGSIQSLKLSSVVSGAIEPKFQVDTVHITPLNQQITYKLERKFNQSCGPRPKWGVYNAELIYEHPQNPIHNSLQVPSPSNMRLGKDCLKSFGIEFDELRLLRVEGRPTSVPFDGTHENSRLQLLFANRVSHVYSRCCYEPTSLQPIAMVRADMKKDCPLCNILSRSTENSPPVLHQAVALPAMIGGYWHSERCESSIGGIWSKRQFQIHSGDRLWTGRWDYYNESQCGNLLYTITAAGYYAQRPIEREYYYKKVVRREIFHNYNGSRRDATRRTANGKVKRRKRSDGVNQYLRNMRSSTRDEWRIEAMLRNRRTSLDDETTTESPSLYISKDIPSGITVLHLHVLDSLLIPEEAALSAHCKCDKPFGVPPSVWREHCVPHSIEVPSILRLRAKIIVNWNGQCVLLLRGKEDDAWLAPLRQCALIPRRNHELQMHLRESLNLRFGLLSSTATSISRFFSVRFYLLQSFLFYVYYRAQ